MILNLFPHEFMKTWHKIPVSSSIWILELESNFAQKFSCHFLSFWQFFVCMLWKSWIHFKNFQEILFVGAQAAKRRHLRCWAISTTKENYNLSIRNQQFFTYFCVHDDRKWLDITNCAIGLDLICLQINEIHLHCLATTRQHWERKYLPFISFIPPRDSPLFIYLQPQDILGIAGKSGKWYCRT